MVSHRFILLPALFSLLVFAGFQCPTQQQPDVREEGTENGAQEPRPGLTQPWEQASQWFLMQPDVRYATYYATDGGWFRLGLAGGQNIVGEENFHVVIRGGEGSATGMDDAGTMEGFDVLGVNVPPDESVAIDIEADGQPDVWVQHGGRVELEDGTSVGVSGGETHSVNGTMLTFQPQENGMIVDISGDVSWWVTRRGSDRVSLLPTPEFLNEFFHFEDPSQATEVGEWEAVLQRQVNTQQNLAGGWNVVDSGFFLETDATVDIFNNQRITFGDGMWSMDWGTAALDPLICDDQYPGDPRCDTTCEFPNFMQQGRLFVFTEPGVPEPPQTSTPTLLFFAPENFVQPEGPPEVIPVCDAVDTSGFFEPFQLDLTRSHWNIYSATGFFPNDEVVSVSPAYLFTPPSEVGLEVPMGQAITIFQNGETGDSEDFTAIP